MPDGPVVFGLGLMVFGLDLSDGPVVFGLGLVVLVLTCLMGQWFWSCLA